MQQETDWTEEVRQARVIMVDLHNKLERYKAELAPYQREQRNLEWRIRQTHRVCVDTDPESDTPGKVRMTYGFSGRGERKGLFDAIDRLRAQCGGLRQAKRETERHYRELERHLQRITKLAAAQKPVKEKAQSSFSFDPQTE